MIDEELRDRLQRAIYEERRGSTGSLDVSRDESEGKTAQNESRAAGLPPPSSDRSKWWLDDGESPAGWHRHLSRN